MLSFADKAAIIESFPELERKDVSLGRVNYHYGQSVHEKKIVVYHLHPNGNGYVYAGLLSGYPTDAKGFVNIRDFGENELRTLLAESIRSLSVPPAERSSPAAGVVREERWVNSEGHSLVLKYEDELWYVFAGLNLESAFETYEEAVDYLAEEGFARS
ncbi:hypothetical protein [Paenibacillus flagellatus]|uniref:Uncharacterized protein n=1 Tax=Paenibacillus flagellatus TaxID=2211139 RepID=A0A2V5KNI9_9BACL|nr:hypothetical protein [Paenibacillus flagellatus]PYI49936.1 hypothetical protein DLM86_31580 [Paenibacillus flagellatus]